MAGAKDTFFTSIGCMDGRVQEPVTRFGQEKFRAQYPDTITEPGMVGILANNPQNDFLAGLKKKIEISLNKHHSRGIIVHGHEDCAPLSGIDEGRHKAQIKRAVKIIKGLIGDQLPISGVFVKQTSRAEAWIVEELKSTPLMLLYSILVYYT